jgi:hypothetical protein
MFRERLRWQATLTPFLDPTFGSGGVAMAFVPSVCGQFNGLAARPDGSVIAAGVTSGETLVAAFQTT